MLERTIPVLRVVCIGLGAIVLLQVAWLTVRSDPLAGLRIPAALNTPAKGQTTETNAVPAEPSKTPEASKANQGVGPAGAAVGPRPGGRPGAAPADLPPGIQNRIDHIVQSEILGPVMRPPPMALLGIAGPDVFFRAPNGQTGLLREGEELGGVKLLQVGTNRVLIQQDGQKKELEIFSGLGSETLLPKGKDTPQ